MRVIDISDWNDNIDWSKVKEAGIGGVIVKISEGRTLSELHAKHIAAAAARNLKWGVYCYSHAATEFRAREEAKVIIEALEALGYGKPPLGVWLDIEAREMLALPAYEVTAIASAFISACNHAGYSAGIYASLYTFTDYLDINLLADYVPYWCAQYADACDFPDTFPGKRLAGWQYTDYFLIDGQAYDLNEWYD